MTKKIISSVLILTFVITGIIQDMAGVNIKDLFASPAVPSSNGALENIKDSAQASQSYQTDLFTGRAQFSVPIFAPPGRRGLTPQTAMSYSSSGGNGWLGIGWGLDHGFIQRSTKKGVPSYNDSQDTFTFLIQGVNSDLVRISSNEYHAKDETGEFLKFIFENNHWKVYDKAGSEYTFGEDPMARMTNSRGIFCWCLEKVKDVYGNTIRYSYVMDQGEMYISRIDYNGNENEEFADTHSVEFILEDRPDITFSYITGARVTTAKRLREIQVKVLGQLSRKYVLSYEQSANVNRSRLQSIQECGTDGVTCLPAQTFEYQNYEPLVDASPTNWYAPIPSGYTNFRALRIFSAEATAMDVFDLNGDARPDRMFTNPNVEYNDLHVFYGNENGFSSQDIPFSNLPRVGTYAMVRENPDGISTASDFLDLNADGFSDRILRDAAQDQWKVYWNQGGVLASNYTAWPISIPGGWTQFRAIRVEGWGRTSMDVFDVNGDGLPDRMYTNSSVEYNDLHIFYNTGNGFSTQDTPFYSLPKVGTYAFVRESISDYDHVSDLIDMNGDNLADRVLYDPNNNQIRIFWNKGGVLESSPEYWNFPIPAGYSTSEFRVLRRWNANGTWIDLLDFNGDGLPDRALLNPSGSQFDRTSVRVYFNNGFGFSEDPVIYSNVPRSGEVAYIHENQNTWASTADFIDMDGDGDFDRVVRNPNSDYLQVYFNQSVASDLLATVRNGRGGVTTIEYKPSTQFDNRDSNGIYRLPFPVNVVSRVTQSDGMGNSVVTNYSYKGGLYDAPTRELRGFRETSVTDARGTQTIHTFHQGEHKKGRSEKIEVKNADGHLFSKEENVWGDCADDVLPGVHFVKLRETNSYLYDGDDTFKRTRKRFEYDNTNGNLLRVFDDGDPEIIEDDRWTENQYTTNESPRILSAVAVTSVYNYQNQKVSEKYFYYDQHQNLNDPPEKGALTKSEDWVANGNRPALSMAYDDFGNVETIRDARNFLTQNEYDSTLHLFVVRVTNTLTHTQEFTYDPFLAQITQTRDQNGQVSRTIYDALGRPVKTISPYDSEAAPTKAVIYDDTIFPNRVIAYEKVSYDAPPLNMNRNPQTGYRTSYSFVDGLGREIQKRTPAEDSDHQVVSGNVAFDTRGQIARQYVPYFADFRTTYAGVMSETPFAQNTYDAVGRRVRIDFPDETFSTVVYDDYVKTVTDANGHLKRYTNDSQGNLAMVEEFNDGATYVTRYFYDALNRLIRTRDHYGRETIVTYDLLGRKTSMTDPNMGTWNYTYDANNNLLTQTDAKERTITFVYDELNRLIRKEYPNGAQIRYTYDLCPTETCGGLEGENYGVGRLLKVEDESGVQTFRYDKLGRVLQDRKAAGDGQFYSFTRLYDPLGRVRTLEYPDGEILNLTFNGMSDVETMTLVSGETQVPIISGVTYNASNQITHIVYGNGVVTDYTYNPQTLRLQDLVTHGAAGAVLQNFHYEFDNVGNVESITDSVHTNSQEFLYDDLDRLIQATGSSQGSYGTHQFQYDAIGNMIQKADAVIRYNDPLHPQAATSFVTPSESIQYSYDQNGNMVTRGNEVLTYDYDNRLKRLDRHIPVERTIHLSAGWNDFTLPFAPFDPQSGEAISDIEEIFSGVSLGTDYDQVSNLENAGWKHLVPDPEFTDFTTFELEQNYRVFVTNPNGFNVTIHGDPNEFETVTVGEYQYDASGARTKKLASGSATYYLGKDFEIEYSSLRQLTRKAFFLGETRVCERELLDSGIPHMRYFHGDHLGSTNVITNGSGAETLLMEYLPYGEVKVRMGSDPVNNTFTGQKEDLETGLMYYNARYYEPKLGRFVTADSIVPNPGNPQDLNRYSYTNNNPIKYVDPSGHKKKKKGFWGFLKKFGAIFISVAATFVGHPYVGALLASAFSTAANKGSVADFAIGLGVGLVSSYTGGNVAGGIAKSAGMNLAGAETALLRGAASGSLGGVGSAAIYGGNIGQSAWQGAAYGAGTAGLVWAKNAYVTEKFLNNNVKWDSSVSDANKGSLVQAIREGGQSPVGQKMMGQFTSSGNQLTIASTNEAGGFVSAISPDTLYINQDLTKLSGSPSFNQFKTLDLATLVMHEMGHTATVGAGVVRTIPSMITDPTNVARHENPYRSWIGSPQRTGYYQDGDVSGRR